jgi:hypothetical protein
MRRRVDLSETIANVYRKCAREWPARIEAELDPGRRARMEELLGEMLEWLEEYDAAGPQ